MRLQWAFTLAAVSPLAANAADDPATLPVDPPAADTSLSATPPEKPDPVGLQEVIVTARKRSESLQEVPLSVTAITADDLREGGFSDLTSVARGTPNVVMSSPDPGHNFTYIRGVGTRRYDPGVDQSVATFVDGVYRGRSYSTNADLLSVERIEVLKGPQGTLYGRNTIGGAISITTAAPRTDSWGGVLAFEPGMSSADGDDFRNYSLAASGPLVQDRIGLSAALQYRDRDGYQRLLDDDPPDGRTRPGLRGGEEDTWSGKLKVGWSLTDALDLTLAGATTRIDGPPIILSPNDHDDPNAVLAFGSPRVPPPEFTGDPRAVATDRDDLELKTRITDLSSSLHWTGEQLEVTSITGFEDSTYRDSNDTDGTAQDVIANDIHEDAHQISEELRFELDWNVVQLLTGVYFSDEHTRRSERLRAGDDSLLADVNALQGVNIDFGTRLKATSSAVFGQLNWDLTEAFELTLGLRYSRDRKKVHLQSANDALVGPIVFAPLVQEYDFRKAKRWTSLDPMVSLKWDIVDDTMVYATYATGYKSGGFQWLSLSEQNARRLFDPENVENYEFGVKSTLFDRRLRVNASLFQMHYRDLQVLVVDSSGLVPITVSQNAAKSTIRGVELESTLLLGDGFALDLNYAFLDATYDDYLQNPDDPSSERRGNTMPRSPRHSIGAAISFESDLGGGRLHARVAYDWRDDSFWEPDNDTPRRDQRERAYGLLDAAMGYAWGRYSLDLWAQNLTNELYRTHVVDLGPTNQLGQPQVSYDIFAPPRTVGLKIGVAFGDAP